METSRFKMIMFRDPVRCGPGEEPAVHAPRDGLPLEGGPQRRQICSSVSAGQTNKKNV